MKKILLFLLPVLALLLFLYDISGKTAQTFRQTGSPCQVVVDIGHGGSDPGKVGINGVLEKDVNLAIGTYLTEYLSAAGYSVTMTRATDMSLADADARNQKLSDFKNRAALIENTAPSAVISIHQNSYSDSQIQGTQVFCPNTPVSIQLASSIQEQCRRILNPDNKRQVKTSLDYYLFRQVTCPIAVVECGFLSNYEEASLLVTEEYQRQTAWAIYMGTAAFLNSL